MQTGTWADRKVQKTRNFEQYRHNFSGNYTYQSALCIHNIRFFAFERQKLSRERNKKRKQQRERKQNDFIELHGKMGACTRGCKRKKRKEKKIQQRQQAIANDLTLKKRENSYRSHSIASVCA